MASEEPSCLGNALCPLPSNVALGLSGPQLSSGAIGSASWNAFRSLGACGLQASCDLEGLPGASEGTVTPAG